MITLRELLEDKQYREFFTTRPDPPRVILPHEMPWRVNIQRQTAGGWARKDFHTYIEAFKFLKPRLKEVHDAAIQSRGVAYHPPFKVVRVVRNGKPVLDEKKKPVLRRLVWTPKLPGDEEPHIWCTYCRRPTVFRWYSKHHAFPKGYAIETPYQRCCICGASERLVLNHA
jgi:hypothetical protein